MHTLAWSAHTSAVLMQRMNAQPLAPETKAHPPASEAGLRSKNGTRLAFQYAGGPDGVDSNLLILLHGLGDRAAPFLQLGKSLQRTLPQTAVLSVQGLKRVPLLEEEAWMWWDTFDMLGELIPNPDPTPAIGVLQHLLHYLCAPEEQGGCAWKAENIHLFGFGQGGSLVLETAVARRPEPLGSVVSVNGPLLSFPTFSPSLTTPLCYVTRFAPPVLSSSSQARSQLTAISKAFAHVTQLNYPPKSVPMDERMIQGPEWRDLHTFWAKFWRTRSAWELEGKLYTVS